MESNIIKVSIVIPSYNAEKTIKAAIESAINQDYSVDNFEIVVVNDGSKDKTSEILESFGSKIRIIFQENQGSVKAANAGFRAAKGKYVIKLDADDIFEKNILKEMATVLDSFPEVDFVYSDYFEKRANGEKVLVKTKENVFNNIAIGIMFRKKKFQDQGFYSERLGFAEYDLLLKTLGKWKGQHIEKPLFWYIRREGSITGDKPWVKNALEDLKKEHPDKINFIQKIRGY